MNKPFKPMIEKAKAFYRARDWEQFHNPKDLAEALSVEASELLELFLWIKREDLDTFIKNPANREEISDEVADIITYLLEFVDVVGIDLEQAFEEKFKKNALKYPVEKSKGKALKYNKL